MTRLNVSPQFFTSKRFSDIRELMYSISDSLSLTSNVNSSPPGQNGRHFAGDIFRCIFVNEKLCIVSYISLMKFVPKGPVDNNPVLV